MLQYLVIAYDGTDHEAADRRMKVRPSHFEMAKELKHHGRFITGGAILNDEGKMIGSMMVVQFETEDDLAHWMRYEPYITGNVWQSIEVKPFRVAAV
ncbi:MAG TPA: YciI family protein [Chitinophagaceae bacterium]